MDKLRLRRLQWAVYLLIAALAIIMMMAGAFILKEGPANTLLFNLSTELLGVTVIFFIVKELFLTRSPEEQAIEDVEKDLNKQRAQMGSLVENMQQLLTKTGESFTNVIPYPNRPAVYSAACATLQRGTWLKLRIFAPVGLWQKDNFKKEWLEAVESHAREQTVKAVWGVFGLPPIAKKGEARPDCEIAEDLKRVQDILSIFDDLKNVTLHFYPPMSASVGFGALVFERTETEGEVAFALSSQSHEDIVDCGFGVDDKQVYFFAKAWFDEQIFWKATDRFVLHDAGTSFTQRWPTIVEIWYGKQYLSSLEAENERSGKKTA